MAQDLRNWIATQSKAAVRGKRGSLRLSIPGAVPNPGPGGIRRRRFMVAGAVLLGSGHSYPGAIPDRSIEKRSRRIFTERMRLSHRETRPRRWHSRRRTVSLDVVVWDPQHPALRRHVAQIGRRVAVEEWRSNSGRGPIAEARLCISDLDRRRRSCCAGLPLVAWASGPNCRTSSVRWTG